MDITEDDRRVANLATELLADQGRPDLAVSGEQLVRWRQVADAVPVSGSRLGGRNQRVQYLPTAPSAAAAIALALDEERNIDRAVLTAFGNGAPVAEQGVRLAARHMFVHAEGVGRRAYVKRWTARSSVPRSLRVPLRHSRALGSSLVSDALLSLALGEEATAPDGAGLVFDELAGDDSQSMPTDERRRLEFVMRWFSFAALRRGASHVDFRRWQEACDWSATTLTYGTTLSQLIRLTGTDPARAKDLLTPLASLITVVGIHDRASLSKKPEGYRNAIMGLIAAMVTWKPKRAQAARDTVRAMTNEIPRLQAAVRYAEALPTEWRPAIALGGAAPFLAQLPDAERERLFSFTRGWLDEHPSDRQTIEASNAPAVEQADGT